MKLFKFQRACFALILTASVFGVMGTSANVALCADEQRQSLDELLADPIFTNNADASEKDSAFYVELVEKLCQEYVSEAQKVSSQEEMKSLNEKVADALKTVFLKTQDFTDAQVKRANSKALFFADQLYTGVGNLDAVKELCGEVKDEGQRNLIEANLFAQKVRNAFSSGGMSAVNALLDEFWSRVEEPAVAWNTLSIFLPLQNVDPELAKSFSERVVNTFQEGTDLQRNIAEKLVGMSRFLELDGNEIKVEGLYLDGEEIDWKSYRGKDVLIGRWATWAEPCRNEISTVQALYEKYRDAGFEVLGYCSDPDVDALKKFVEERKLPWKTASEALSDQAKKNGGKEYVNLSSYYGAKGISGMIFVGKDGKVVDKEINCDRLTKLLEERFPDVK